MQRFVILLGIIVSSPVALAAQFASEPFNYPAGTLIGQNGGSGFAGAWTGSGGGVFSPGLSYPGYNAAGNAAFTPGSDSGAFRQLTGAQGVGDLNVAYIAFLIQAPDATDPDYAGLSLMQGGTEELFIGKRFGQTTYGVERSGTAVAANSTVQSNTATHLLITQIVFGSGSSPGNERILFYVDPTLNAGPIFPSFTLPDVPSFTFDTIRIQSGNSAQSYNFDDIRMGTALSDVVSTVPEPASFSLLAGAVTALIGRRRR